MIELKIAYSETTKICKSQVGQTEIAKKTVFLVVAVDGRRIKPTRHSSDDFEEVKKPETSKNKKKTSRGPLDDTPERTKLYRKYIIHLKSLGITDDMLSQKV